MTTPWNDKNQLRLVILYDNDNDNGNILFDHNIHIYTTDLQ